MKKSNLTKLLILSLSALTCFAACKQPSSSSASFSPSTSEVPSSSEKEETKANWGTAEAPITVADAINNMKDWTGTEWSEVEGYLTGKIVSISKSSYGDYNAVLESTLTGNETFELYGAYLQEGVTEPVAGSTITVKGHFTKYIKSDNSVIKYEVAFSKPNNYRPYIIASDAVATEPETPETPSVPSVTIPEGATTVTKIVADYASANGWTNGTLYSSLTIDSSTTATVSVEKASSYGQNSGKYYTSGTNWRIYQSETPTLKIEVAEGKELVAVAISYVSEKTGAITYEGKVVESGVLVAANGSSISFGVGNTGTATNGQARITEIKVAYLEETSSEPETPSSSESSQPSTSEPSEPETSEPSEPAISWGTESTPLTVAQALEAMANFKSDDITDVEGYVEGTVQSVSYSSQHSSYTIVLENKFTLYGAKLANGVEVPVEGDKVVGKGYFTLKYGTYELAQDCSVVSTTHSSYAITSNCAADLATIEGLPATANSGSTVSFTVTPAAGKLVVVKVNGKSIAATNNTYSFVVTGASEVTVSELSTQIAQSYTLKSVVTANGTASSSADLCADLNLPSDFFSISYTKTSATDMAIRTDGVRMYSTKNNLGNEFTVSLINTSKTIVSVTIVFDNDYSSTAAVYAGSSETAVEGTDGTYLINATSFTLQNDNRAISDKNTQLRFQSITITLSE